MGNNWMIPTEALDHPCILVAADEARALCYLGLVVARLEHLTVGKNKDSKRSISAQGFSNIFWLLCEHPYPANFWRTVPSDAIITRDVVEAVAQQKDFMRRIRSDNGRGTRDILAREGIALLSGDFDAELIAKLSLPPCLGSEFISHKATSLQEAQIIRAFGIELTL